MVAEASTVIPHRHQRMLMSILDLERINVEDIMVPRNEIAGIDVSDEWEDILDQLRESRHTRIPVYDGSIDELVGILHMKKVARLLARDEFDREQLVALARAREPYYVPEGTSLNTQLLNFQRQRRRVAFVVDEYGDVQGLVTLEDLLEEIVGEFTSDTSSLHKDVHREKGGSFIVNASASVRTLNRKMGWTLPTSGPRTLNGLIIEYLETIPEAGTSLRVDDYSIDILQTGDNAVKTVRLRPITAPARARGVRKPRLAPARAAARPSPRCPRSPGAARWPPAPARAGSPASPPRAGVPRRTAPAGPRRSAPVRRSTPCRARRGRLRRLDSTASTAGRSAAVSPMRTPPTTLTNTSCPDGGDAAVPVQHGQQQRQAPSLEADRDAARRHALRLVHQRLQLDQQRPAALARPP